MKLLALVTDAFGGRGGIAKVNRDLLHALCTHDAVAGVTAIPRLVIDPPSDMPVRLRYLTRYADGKRRYVRGVLATVRSETFNGVICGHIHLLPLAWYVARRSDAVLLLVIHGIEAWTPPRNPITRFLARKVDAVISVSEFTKRRFLSWSRLPEHRVRVIPNCVDLSRFGPGPKSAALLNRYRLAGRTVLLTVGRLAGAERSKGFDEVIRLLPELSKELPDIAYLVVGEGRDRDRLLALADRLGVADRVMFTGHVDEDEKADHYRLADAFVMPSRGEGFGIVHLEALACGVPVIASSLDGSREAVRGGTLGQVVNPDDSRQLRSAILEAVRRDRVVPEGLAYFSEDRFRDRWGDVIGDLLSP